MATKKASKTRKAPKAHQGHDYYYSGDDFSFGPFKARDDDEAASIIENRPTTMRKLFDNVLDMGGYGYVKRDDRTIWLVSRDGEIFKEYFKPKTMADYFPIMPRLR